MPEDVALVALGGYGRGTLAPGSDLDLLILHEGSADEVSLLAERLLYPLWDAGLQVGHAVRTAEVCVEIAAERLDATTAMLDGRLLAGSAPGWDEVRSAVLAPVRGDPIAFAQRLVADRDARRERFGSVSSLLEPELKEGVGGLRDVHALGWVRTAIGRPLEEGGILREAERRSVDGADEFLTRVRSALHLETGRGSDRLLAEQQPSIAAAMGFADEPGLPAVDGLMRSVFEQARQVEHVTASVFDRFLRGTSPPAPLDATPEGILRAFASSARDGHVMPAASLDAMSAVAIDAERPWTGPTRSAFLELLRCGPAAVDALETLDRIGLLERYVPAWGPVRCRPQRDPYHRSSVDVHLLATLAGAARLLEDPGDDPSVALAVRVVPDADALRLGALLHDIGKTGEGHHVETGTSVARETLDHVGASGPTADLALFLVAEHLLLSDTATRRDLDDERLIVDVADRGRRSGSSGGALPPDDRRRRGHGSARVDAVARGPGPRARRQGPARPRTRRRGFGHRRAADGTGGGDPRGARGRGRRGGRTLLATDAPRLRPDGPGRPRADPPPPARPGRGFARGAHPRHRGLARRTPTSSRSSPRTGPGCSR